MLDPAHEDYNHYMPDELNKIRKIKWDSKPKQPKIYKSSGLLLKIASHSIGRTILGLVPMVRKYQKYIENCLPKNLRHGQMKLKKN